MLGLLAASVGSVGIGDETLFGSLHAKQEETYQLDFDIIDPEGDTVILDVQGLPEYAYLSGNTSLIWDIAASQVGKNYTMTAVITDSLTNSYLETFTIYASHFANGIMKYEEGMPSSEWTLQGTNCSQEYIFSTGADSNLTVALNSFKAGTPTTGTL